MTNAQTTRISRPEFIAICAMMFATIAFSIDAMLPALPEIAAELSPTDPNRAQLIITSFVLGMGIGTFLTGPLSDSFGRKKIIIIGSVVYSTAAFVAWSANSIEVMLAARIVQGIGAAGPRVVTIALIRDLFSGREMARLMSFIMMVFTLVPAIAPLLGTGVIAIAGWHGIFIAFIMFSIISTVWMALRIDETLPKEKRSHFQFSALWDAMKELMSYPSVRISILAQGLCLSMLFSMISLVQPVYDITFGKADSFPFWFAGVALVAGSASLLNAVLVMKLGMRKLVTVTLAIQIGLSAVMIFLSMSQISFTLFFGFFVLWQTSVFFQAGMTLGNLNALAMEPVGHIAGFAASIIGGISTVIGGAMAMPVAMMFDGSPLPLAIAICLEAIVAFALMLWLKRIETRAG